MASNGLAIHVELAPPLNIPIQPKSSTISELIEASPQVKHPNGKEAANIAILTRCMLLIKYFLSIGYVLNIDRHPLRIAEIVFYHRLREPGDVKLV